MEKTRLLELLKSEPSDIDAIGMILSNYTDYGHSELGGMVSVKKFNDVAECLLEWWDGKNTTTSQEQLATPAVSYRRELLFAFIKDWKEEFKDENWDYLDFMAERFLGKQ